MTETPPFGNQGTLIGKKLGDYELLELLTSGGMARIYKGLDRGLMRYAAVKVLMGELLDGDDTLTERFEREARAIAQLEHPHIVPVYQRGVQEGYYFMAMRLIDGNDLADEVTRLRRLGQQMPPHRALHILNQVADALDYAHGKGIVHRDIKPSNILLTADDRAFLTDFGLALWSVDKTMGTAFGTPRYIAPEQALASEKAVPQSDIYALAVILYEILTGDMLFHADTPMQIALSHISEPPPPPRSINPNIPQGVEDEVLRALSKEPALRHQTAGEFIRAVRAAYGEKVAAAAPVPPKPSAPPVSVTAVDAEPLQPAPRPQPIPRPKTETQTMAQAPAELRDGLSAGRRGSPAALAVLVVIILIGLVGAALVVNSINSANASATGTAVALVGLTGTADAANETATIAAEHQMQTSTAEAMAAAALMEQNTATAAAALVTAAPPITTSTATDVPTDAPTDMPTDAPTLTDTPTDPPNPTASPTATRTASSTPTPRPTATPTNTSTATPTTIITNTPRPTNTLGATALPITPSNTPILGGVEVLAVYAVDAFLMRHTGELPADVRGLSFANLSGSEFILPVGTTLTRGQCILFQPQGRTFNFAGTGCNRDTTSVSTLNPTQIFWRATAAGDAFTVSQNGQVVATCPSSQRAREEACTLTLQVRQP